jgi:hypothetical protein
MEYLLIGYFLCDDYEGSDIDKMIFERLPESTEVFTLTFNDSLFEKYAEDPADFFAVEKCKSVTNFIAQAEVGDYLDYIRIFFEDYKDSLTNLKYIQLPIFGFIWDIDIMKEFLKHAKVITPLGDIYETFATENNVNLVKGDAFETQFGVQTNGKRFILSTAKTPQLSFEKVNSLRF